MARKLIFKIGGKELSADIVKIDRSKLYGSASIEAFDDNGRRAEMMSLASDGQTIFGIGGTAFATLNADNDPVRKEDLRPFTPEGEPLEAVESSFNAPIEVAERVSVEEYLSHLVKAVYQIAGEDAAGFSEALNDGAIYKFAFSYRGGVLPDTAFLMNNADGQPFLILTTPASLSYVGFQDNADFFEDSEAPDEDELDFEMM